MFSINSLVTIVQIYFLLTCNHLSNNSHTRVFKIPASFQSEERLINSYLIGIAVYFRNQNIFNRKHWYFRILYSLALHSNNTQLYYLSFHWFLFSTSYAILTPIGQAIFHNGQLRWTVASWGISACDTSSENLTLIYHSLNRFLRTQHFPAKNTFMSWILHTSQRVNVVTSLNLKVIIGYEAY